jgi:hypothetical protein
MKTKDAQGFLDELAHSQPDIIDLHFLLNHARLRLAGLFNRNELTLLHQASRLAALCQAAFNDDGAHPGETPREREVRRGQLEQAFLEARDALYASPEWQDLKAPTSQAIKSFLLTAYVLDSSLAS